MTKGDMACYEHSGFFPTFWEDSPWLWNWEFYRHFHEIGKINSLAFFSTRKVHLLGKYLI